MTNKINIKLPNTSCTGCAACMNVCPKNAISLPEDEYGFIHSKINAELCIQCHLCEKTCPAFVKTEKNAPLKIFAAVCKDKNIQKTSASGGIAYSLCQEILQDGGVAYGCCEENYFTIRHIRVDKIEDLRLLQNSKYVQSDIGYIMRNVKKDVKDGKKVIFTGTPCQIAGLLNYLKKTYDNLFTVDVICHGVCPMTMLKDQIDSYSIKNTKPSDIYVDFRWKTNHSAGVRLHFGLRTAIQSGRTKNIIREENEKTNSYMNCYLTGISLRDSCLNCQYASKGRVSDITIGDFWGVGTDIPSHMSASSGTSLVIINNDKGLNAFNNIKDKFIFEEHTFNEASTHNRCLSKPWQTHPKRRLFLKLYKEKGLRYAAKKTDVRHRYECIWLIKFCRNSKFLYHFPDFVLRALCFLRNIKPTK